MRRRRPARWEEEDRELNLQIAPLLDLLFVMLLFFMITAGNGRRERELDLRLPPPLSHTTEAKTEANLTPAPIRIDIDADGEVFLNHSSVAKPHDARLLGLQEKLRHALTETARDAEPLVVISPAAGAYHQRVMDVLSACAGAQVHRLAFSAAAD